MAGTERQVVATQEAPEAIGPYSQAIRVEGLLFTSGQVPLDPASGALIEGGIREQTAQVMRNLEAVLRAAGCSFEDVIKTTCFLTDLSEFAQFNEVYGGYFQSEPPARSTVQVGALPRGASVEVEMVARLPQ